MCTILISFVSSVCILYGPRKVNICDTYVYAYQRGITSTPLPPPTLPSPQSLGYTYVPFIPNSDIGCSYKKHILVYWILKKNANLDAHIL